MSGENVTVLINDSDSRYFEYFQIHGYTFLGFNGNDPIYYSDFNSAIFEDGTIKLYTQGFSLPSKEERLDDVKGMFSKLLHSFSMGNSNKLTYKQLDELYSSAKNMMEILDESTTA